MKTQNLEINGKKATLDVVGKPNERAVYIFLRTPGLFGDVVYGIDYDKSADKIVNASKFKRSSSSYDDFLSQWGLNHRMFDTFNFSIGVASSEYPGGSHEIDRIEDNWDFSDGFRLKQKEQEDLEKIVNQLKTSHIDFALRSSPYKDLLKFQYLGKNPEEIVEEELKKLDGAYLGNAAGAYRGAEYFAKHPEVEDIATIENPKLTVRRKYSYNNPKSPKWYDYKFEGGKHLEGWGPFIYFLSNPYKNGVCYVRGQTATRFLDALGNEIGETLLFQERLTGLDGIFKNNNGIEKHYHFAIKDNESWRILDERGQKIATANKRGFLYSI
jgi:hypothetical protein